MKKVGGRKRGVPVSRFWEGGCSPTLEEGEKGGGEGGLEENNGQSDAAVHLHHTPYNVL